MKQIFGGTILVLAGALVQAPQPVQAQNVLGFGVGASIAKVGGDIGDDLDESRVGITASASITFPLSGNLGLQIGAGYTEKGGEGDIDGGTGTLRLDYIDVPVLLRLGIPSAGPLAAHGYLGAALGFESKCEVEGSEGGVSFTVDCDTFEGEFERKSVDVGLVGGLGIDYEIGAQMSLVLDLLYNLGLTDVHDTDAPDESVKNRTFLIRAGLAIPLL